MSISTTALAERTTTSFGLSIGTGLCLETLFEPTQPRYDPERIIPAKVSVSDYDEVWVNLATLFRNIHSAVTGGGAAGLLPEDVAETMQTETKILSYIVEQNSGGKTKVVYYVCNYAGLKEKYPHARIRVDSTDKQKMYTALLVGTLNAFMKMHTKEDGILHFKLKLEPPATKKVLLISHFAFDLVSRNKFSKLDLLESHTGILKDRSLWHTKLQGGKDLVYIPFCEMSLQVFGDSTLFYQNDRKLREAVIEVAQTYKWNFATTDSRIKLGIGFVTNPYFITVLKSMI